VYRLGVTLRRLLVARKTKHRAYQDDPVTSTDTAARLRNLKQLPSHVCGTGPVRRNGRGTAGGGFDCHKRDMNLKILGGQSSQTLNAKFTASRVVLLVVFIEDTALVASAVKEGKESCP